MTRALISSVVLLLSISTAKADCWVIPGARAGLWERYARTRGKGDTATSAAICAS
jgi:hypothetical protein